MNQLTALSIDLNQRAKAVQWCSENQIPALPVAPRQDARKYPVIKKSKSGDYCPLDIEGKYGEPYGPTPLFNGKNPSYLESNGTPKLIRHTRYQNKLPTDKELSLWFECPSTGVGVLAGAGNVDWIDIDRKNFDSQESCDNAAARILEYCDRTYYERTRSGGCHIAIRLESKKDFTNFKLGKDGHHIGEFLGYGRFVVLAPTPGYEALNGTEIATVKDAESLGLYPVKSEPDTPSTVVDVSKQWSGKSVELYQVITKKNNSILKGQPPTNCDRSKTLVSFARDVYGWFNFCTMRGVVLPGIESSIQTAAESLDIEPDRIERILEKVNASSCIPALEKTKGVEACEKRLAWAIDPPKKEDYIRTDDIEVFSEDTVGLVVFRELYESKPHITVGDSVYKFVGTHFELVNPGKRRHEIAGLCKRCIKAEVGGGGNVHTSRPYATARSVSCAMNYTAALMPAVAPDEIGSAGINCTNGVLKLSWKDGQLQRDLVPHDPSMVFLSEPKVTYNPVADDQYYRALMQAVEPEFQPIVLRTLASSLDLVEVRKRQHRPVRIAAFLGGGSNGKDALKVAMGAILSNRGLTSVPLSAFQQYDQGRQFGLAALAGSRVNWPSENAFTSTLDSLECIKSAVTGEPLQYEQKNKDAVEFSPCATLIFNGNADTLKLLAGNEAVRSRYAVIPFNKTFKRNPDPRDSDELQADPRFKNDAWVAENVAPAMLNVLLDELNNLANDGIDYSPIDAVMDEHSKASFHLAEFLDDVGLVAHKGINPKTGELSRVKIDEIWNKLLIWYKNEDLVTEDSFSGKITFNADPRPGDKLIRTKQQLSAMLIKFISGANNKGPGSKSNGVRYLLNVAWKTDLEEPAEEPTVSDIDLAAMLADVQNYEEYTAILEAYKLAKPSDSVVRLIPKADRDRILIFSGEIQYQT